MQHPVINTEAGSNPGAPLAWGSPENPDEVVAGYGYVAADTSDVEETFYYHSDHLGSTAYITDQKANVTQYDAYLPYGELLVDEHSSSADLPYKFNGKELDEETGLYYYGARYMNPVTSMWYGVDPLADKYTNVSAFAYCAGNPVKLVDPDGAKILPWYTTELNQSGTSYLIDEYRSHVWTIRAMKEIGKTKVGNAFISSFLDKGTRQYDVHGNGKYAEYTLNIRSLNISDGTQSFTTVGDKMAAIGIRFDEDGKLFFVLSINYMECKTYEDLIESLTHEIGLHGAKIDATIKAFEKGGEKAARKAWNSPSEKEDHMNLKNGDTKYQGVKNYKSMQKELENKNPKNKRAFQKAAKQYKSVYKS